MTEAIFGLIGVLMGSGLTFLQTYWTTKHADIKNAKYLAIRVICVLDKYIEDCIEVVKDDGLLCGQRDSEGCLKPQVKSPAAPVFPEDVDWKAIDQDLMYKLLSISSEIDSANRMIKFSADIASPPDYEEWFDERRFYYSQFGLTAYKLSEELSKKYSIQMKVYNNWNPVSDLQQELDIVISRRQKRFERHQHFIKKVLDDK